MLARFQWACVLMMEIHTLNLCPLFAKNARKLAGLSKGWPSSLSGQKYVISKIFHNFVLKFWANADDSQKEYKLKKNLKIDILI